MDDTAADMGLDEQEALELYDYLADNYDYGCDWGGGYEDN